MIQDIGEGRFHNEYKSAKPEAESRVLAYRDRTLLVRKQEDTIAYLTYREFAERCPQRAAQCTYLFSIDEIRYYLVSEIDETEFPGFTWESMELMRTARPREAAFAGVTGFQLADWYASRRFCPRCAGRMVHDERERMMRCPACGLTEYPKISPAVIVGVTNKDKLLLTKYAGRDFKKYALIAGFAEIGETIEETVKREVMEEVGLKIRNIRYYKSQPWSFSGTLLMGFFADLDGEGNIHLDETELSEGKWCTRDEIPKNDGVSLTREMMQVFREGRENCF